jgi:hypothetical protein
MTTDLIFMIGYLRTPEEYRDAEKILRTLTAVAEQGYYITPTGDEEPEPPLKAGISPTLSAHLEAYLTGNESHLSTEAYVIDGEGPRSGFSYGPLSLDAQHEMLMVSVDDRYFPRARGKREDPTLYTHWLDMLQLTYDIWHPLYGYPFPNGIWPETSLADARALQPQHLYEHNYFGPELVKKIGRERLLRAPAWQIRSFADGGVLVIPRYLYGEPGPDTMPAVAEALGLPYDTQELRRQAARIVEQMRLRCPQ